MWVKAAFAHEYPPLCLKSTNNPKYDTLIDVTLLFAKMVQPTRCSKYVPTTTVHCLLVHAPHTLPSTSLDTHVHPMMSLSSC